MATHSWVALTQNTEVPDIDASIDDRFAAVLAMHTGTEDPATGGTNPAYAVAGMLWADENQDPGGSGIYYVRQRDRADAAWNKLWRRDEDFGGLLDSHGGNAMQAAFDLDGYDVVLDQDGDTKIVGDRDAGVSDDQIAFRIGGASPNIRAMIDGTYLDLEPSGGAALQIRDPKRDGTTSVGAVHGRILVEVDGMEKALLVYDLS